MELEELKKVVRQIGGTRLTVRNSNLMATCPVHSESHPSWGININEPHAHGCFACGFTGTLLTLLKKFNFPADYIEQACGVQTFVAHIDRLIKTQHPSSGISARNPDELFPFKRTSQVSKYLCGKRKINPQKLLSLELYYDPNHHAVVFPHWINGNFLGATERLIAIEKGAKTLPMFDLKKRSTLYSPTGKITPDPLVVVEGEIDAINVFASGYENVVALCFGRLTRDQALLMKLFGVTEVILFFDQDPLKLGETETTSEKFLQRAIDLLKKNFKIRVAEYPGYYKKDTKVDPAMLKPQEITKCIDKSGYRFGIDKKLRLI